MITAIKRLYKKSLLLGLSPDTEFKEKLKIELSNQFIFIGLTCVFLHNIINLIFLQSLTDFCLTMVWFVILTPSLFLNIAKRPALARLYLALGGILSVFILHILFGTGLKLESFYILFLVVAALFFEFAAMIKYAFLVIFLFLLATVINIYIEPMFATLVKPSGAFTRFIFSVTIISALIGKLVFENRLYNTVISKQNEQLQLNKKYLENTNKKLTTSNEELKRFNYIASHDLKTPLHNIINFSGILEQQITIEDKAGVEKSLSFIKTGGERMMTLIEDILEYSKLANENKDSRQWINLNDLIIEVEQSMLATLQENNATLKVSILPKILSNPTKIFLLLKNFIENGIKYNDANSPLVRIYAKKNQKVYSLFICDNGIGIPEEFFSKIFTMFTRLHNHEKYKGTGLGLSTCKKIVDELEGTIEIESYLGKGTTFEIKLPIGLFEVIEPALI